MMKKLLLLILSVIILFLILVVLVYAQQVDPVQKPPQIRAHSFADTLAMVNYNLDSLKSLIGDHKGLPEGFEIPAAIALSAYPELKEVKIDMILTPGGAPMESTVDIWSLFGARKNRQYRILLNDADETFFEPILLRSLPFDAQVGILAHELGHIAYYHKLNVFKFGKWGLNYLNDDAFRSTHERSTDLMPVYHGLGSQIYQYAWFVRKDPSCLEFFKEEKDFMDKYYMTDKELAEIIDEISLDSK